MTPSDDTGPYQEIISVGDKIGFSIVVGAADRYLIRGVTFAADSTLTESGGAGFINPFWLRSDSLSGDRHFDLVNTRDVWGQGVWTAPQGATVEGGCTTDSMTMDVTCNRYVLDWGDFNVTKQNGVDRIGSILTLIRQVAEAADGQADAPTAPGVFLGTGDSVTDSACRRPDTADGRPRRGAGSDGAEPGPDRRPLPDRRLFRVPWWRRRASPPVPTRSSTGCRASASTSRALTTRTCVPQVPDDSASVSVSVHADSNGKPGDKLFDLVSPTEFAPGHSFFEAPPRTYLQPDTSYVLVWSHTGGTEHRLQRTSGSSEDLGARTWGQHRGRLLLWLQPGRLVSRWPCPGNRGLYRGRRAGPRRARGALSQVTHSAGSTYRRTWTWTWMRGTSSGCSSSPAAPRTPSPENIKDYNRLRPDGSGADIQRSGHSEGGPGLQSGGLHR